MKKLFCVCYMHSPCKNNCLCRIFGGHAFIQFMKAEPKQWTKQQSKERVGKRDKQELKLIYIFFFSGAFALFVTQRSRQWEKTKRIQLVFSFICSYRSMKRLKNRKSRNMMSTIRCWHDSVAVPKKCDTLSFSIHFWITLRSEVPKTERSSPSHVYPIQGLCRVNFEWVYSLIFYWKFQTSDRLVLSSIIYWWLEPVSISIRQTIVNWEFANIAHPFRFHKLKCITLRSAGKSRWSMLLMLERK